MREGFLFPARRRTAGLGFCAACLLLLFSRAVAAQSPAAEEEPALQQAIEGVRLKPSHYDQYDYIMTARVRLLIFWAGKDDVGGGYIRRGVLPQDPESEVIELLMGSDPAKAPRAINRWGAATEVVRKPPGAGDEGETSTFFGFMKVSKGTSAAEMQKELAQEKQRGTFLFSAILNQASREGNVAKVVPFASDQDFTIHEVDRAEPTVLDRLAGPGGRFHRVSARDIAACGRPEGFLSSVAELVDASLEGRQKRASLCYFYNGEKYSLTLLQVSKAREETVQLTLHDEPRHYKRTYHDLLRARFENFNETTRKGSTFDLLLGTEGPLRGVPVQISYQPNWWFQVVLNLKTPEPPAAQSGQLR